MLKENIDLLEILVKVCKDHHAELASRLVQIFLETDNIIDKLIRCNQVIIDRESKCFTNCITDNDISVQVWIIIMKSENKASEYFSI